MTYPILLPNTGFDSEVTGKTTIIASVVSNDDDPEGVQWLLLLLKPEAPYYLIAEWDEAKRAVYVLGEYENIVPAVESYQQFGGDY